MALIQYHNVLPVKEIAPDSKVYGSNMGPSWGRQDPGGPHGGPKNLAIWANVEIAQP